MPGWKSAARIPLEFSWSRGIRDVDISLSLSVSLSLSHPSQNTECGLRLSDRQGHRQTERRNTIKPYTLLSSLEAPVNKLSYDIPPNPILTVSATVFNLCSMHSPGPAFPTGKRDSTA